MQNDPECGASGILYRWVDDGDNYICEFPDTPQTVRTRWVTLPRSNWICDGWNLHPVEKEQLTEDDGMTWVDTGITATSEGSESNAVECSQKTNCVFHNGAGGMTFDCLGDRTTTAMAVYLDYKVDWAENAANYVPDARIVTNSPQGNGWYSVHKTSHTVEAIQYRSYRIDINSNNDEGEINCYWVIYDRNTDAILHTTDTFTITRNAQQ